MRIEPFVCCTPTDGSNHCGKEHRDFREAVACMLEYLTTVEVDREAISRRIVVGIFVDLHDGGGTNLYWTAETLAECIVKERRYLERLGAGCHIETDDDIVRSWRLQLTAVRRDLERNPPAVKKHVLARRTHAARKAA